MSTNTKAEYEQFEDFGGGHNMETWGVGTEVVSYTSDEAGGVIKLATGASDDDNVVIAAKGFQPSLGVVWAEAKMKAAVLTLNSFNFGFTDTLDGTTPVLPFEYATTTLTTAPVSGAAFLYDVDGTTDVLRLGAVKANVDTVNQAAGEPNVLTADTYITLRVEMDPNGTVRWYADGKLLKEQTSAITPATVHFAFAMAEARSASSRDIEIDYFTFHGNRQ